MGIGEAMKPYQTILQQIGGRRFAAMTGAHCFLRDGDNTLSFKFKGSKAFNYCAITLDTGLDLYTMRLVKTHGTEIKQDISLGGLYFDQLEDTFSDKTGLATRL